MRRATPSPEPNGSDPAGRAGGGPTLDADDQAGDLLAVAAVLGSAFDVEDLAILAGRSMGEVLPAVVEGVARGILDGSGSQLAFRSDALRRQLLAGLSSWTFRRLTAVSGGVRPRPPSRPVGEGALADGTRTLRWLRWTAERVGASAPEAAVELLQSAVPLADGDEREALVAELALALLRASRHEEGEAVCRQALRHPPPDTELALREALVASLVTRGRLRDAEHEAGVALASGLERRSWFLAVQCLTLVYSHRLPEADRLARDAEALAYREDDRRARALALRARALVALFEVRLADADRLCSDMLEVAAEARGEPYGAALLVSALVYTDLDRPLDALQVLGRGARLIDAAGLAVDAPIIAAYAGAAHFWSGRWDDAASELAAAVQVPGGAAWFVDAAAQLAVLWAARGSPSDAARWAALAETAAPMTGPAGSPGRLEWMRGMLAEAEGDLAAAQAHLSRGWLATEAAGVARERRVIGPPLVRLEVQAGGPLAPRVVAALAEMAAANPHVPGLAGAAAWCDGLVRRDAERVLEGLELLRVSGRRHEAARCALDAAVLLASGGEDTGSSPARTRAEALLVDALAGYEQLGAAAERDRALAALHVAGVTLPAGRRPARIVGWSALTPTEQRVAGLVAEGLSNREVAARLFVSPRTVSTHVSRILGKLGVRSRTELAVAVYREREDPAPGLERLW